MNWLGIVAIGVGIALVVMGWEGTYTNVWNFLAGTSLQPPGPGGGSSPQGQAPPAGQQQGPPQFGLRQQQQGQYGLSLGNHQYG